MFKQHGDVCEHHLHLVAQQIGHGRSGTAIGKEANEIRTVFDEQQVVFSCASPASDRYGHARRSVTDSRGDVRKEAID